MTRPHVLVLACLTALFALPAARADGPAKFRVIEREARDVEGWKVRLDRRLLSADHTELCAQVLRVLGFKLYEIKRLVPAAALAKLQAVTIVVDLECGKLTVMQYHPSAGWLQANGHDPVLARCVHLGQADELLSYAGPGRQPMVVLHELAHAYHDQVLGFDESRVRDAWVRYRESGKGDKVLHVSGRVEKHYALTTQMEFFAEMTEAYFGTNDFYPFVRAELAKELPEVHKLLEEIWGAGPRAR